MRRRHRPIPDDICSSLAMAKWLEAVEEERLQDIWLALVLEDPNDPRIQQVEAAMQEHGVPIHWRNLDS